jgi:hypothetical protein
MNEEQQEEWRPVVGWEGLYEVSSLGRFATVARDVPCRNGGRRHVRHRILKTQINQDGYYTITFCRYRKWSCLLTHRLVVEAFIGPIPADRVVNHLDACKTNNNLENLEICTIQWNAQHSRRVSKTNIGSDVVNSKLNEEAVRGCRLANANGISVAELARRFSVSPRAMWNAVHPRGRTWRHVS